MSIIIRNIEQLFQQNGMVGTDLLHFRRPTALGQTKDYSIALNDFIAILVAAVPDKGSLVGFWDASGGQVPTTGTGMNGGIRKGDFWIISVGGTLSGVQPFTDLHQYDLLIATISNASTGSDFVGNRVIGGGGVAVAAGTNTISSGMVIFSNSNGISFGLDTNSVLTVSYTVPNTSNLISAINVSAGTASKNLSNLVFSNSNSVSFGLSGSTITGSVSFNQSVQTQASVQVQGSSGSIVFSNSNGITFGFSNSTITASHNGITTQSIQTQNSIQVQGSTGSIQFSNSNGISFGFSNSVITASHNGITSQSIQTQNSVQVQGSTGNIQFSNSNGISFGFSNSTVTASYTVPNVPAQTNQSIGLYAVSNTTLNSSGTIDARTLSVEGAGNVSVGFSNGSLIISAPVAGAGGIALAAGTQTATNSTVVFSNSNGISFGMSGSTQVTASYTVPIATSWTVSDAVTSVTVGRLAFTNSNGLTLSLSTSNNGNHTIIGSYTVPTITNSTLTISDANTSIGINRLAFTNSNGLTLSLSTGAGGSATLIGSYTVPSTTGLLSNINISAGTTSNNLSAVTFSNSNGITFGLNASTVTASHNGLTSQSNQVFSAQGGSSAFQTLIFTNSNGISFSNTNGSIWGSVATSLTAINVSAGTTSNNLSAVVFSNSNNITFGLSGSTVTASYTVPSVTNSSWTVSDAATSVTVGRLAFTNSNGLTLSLSTSNNGNHTVIGSYTVPTVTNSSWTVSDSATSVTVGRLAFTASNGLTLSLSTSNNGNHTVIGSYTVPTQTNQTVGIYASSQTTGSISSATYDARSLSIIGAGAVSIGNNSTSVGGTTTGLIISVPVQSAQTQSNVQAISAGTQAGSTGNIVFSNSNGISFGMSNSSVVTVSYTVPTVTNSSWTVSDAATSVTVGRLAFTNSNGLTLSLSTSNNGNHTVIGSYTVPTLTNSSLSITAGNGSSIGSLSQLYFSNANGLSFGLSTSNNGSATLTVSYTVPTQSNQTVGIYGSSQTTGSASSFTYDARSLSIIGAGAISIGNNSTSAGGTTTGIIISAPVQSNQTFGEYAVGNTVGQSSSSTFDARTQSISGLGNVSVGFSNNNLIISGATAATAINFSAGTTSSNIASVVFSNSNGVSFGISSSTITASIATSLTNINLSAGTTSNNLSAFVLSNSNRISFGLNGSTVTAQHALNFSAGSTSNNISDGVTFSNGNGISFGLNGSTITADVRLILSTYEPFEPQGLSTAFVGVPTATSAGVSVFPFELNQYVSVGILNIPFSISFVTLGTSSGQQTMGLALGIYSLNASTLSSIASTSLSYGITGNNSSYSINQVTATSYSGYAATAQTNSAGVNITSGYTGMKIIGFPVNTLLTPGNYYLGFIGTNSTSSVNVGLSLSYMGAAQATGLSAMAPVGSFSSAYTSGQDPRGGRWDIGQGSWTSAGSVTMIPVSMNMASVSAVAQTYPLMRFWST